MAAAATATQKKKGTLMGEMRRCRSEKRRSLICLNAKSKEDEGDKKELLAIVDSSAVFNQESEEEYVESSIDRGGVEEGGERGRMKWSRNW